MLIEAAINASSDQYSAAINTESQLPSSQQHSYTDNTGSCLPSSASNNNLHESEANLESNSEPINPSIQEQEVGLGEEDFELHDSSMSRRASEPPGSSINPVRMPAEAQDTQVIDLVMQLEADADRLESDEERKVHERNDYGLPHP